MSKWFLLLFAMMTLLSCTNPAVQISFSDPLGESVIEAIDVNRNETIASLPTPTRSGYMFLGWYYDAATTEPFDFDTPITDHLTLYAKWEIAKHQLSFFGFDGTLWYQVLVNYGSSLASATPQSTPSHEGHTFTGWLVGESNGQPIDPAAVVTADLSLFSQWDINQYLLTLLDFDDTILQEVMVSFDASLDAYEPIPKRFLGYEFVGWNPRKPDTMPAAALTLTANYAKIVDSIQSFSLNEAILDVSANVYSTAVITASGRLYKWGRVGNPQWLCGPYDNSFDTLIPLDMTSYFDLNQAEQFVAVQLGLTEHLALTNQGRVFEWRYRHYCAQDPISSNNPLVVTDLTPQFLLIADEIVTEISSFGYHYLFLTSNHRIFAMRLDTDGTFQSDSITPIDVTSRFLMNPNEMAIQVIAGHMNSVVLTSQGRLFVWGRNAFHSMGIGDVPAVINPTVVNEHIALAEGEVIREVALGRYHMLLLTNLNRVFATGVNAFGSLGDGTTNDSWMPIDITASFAFAESDAPAMVFAGTHNSFLVTIDGDLYAWGANGYGQLGDDSMVNQLTPLQITDRFEVPLDETILKVDSMIATPILVTSDGTIYIWGDKSYGIDFDELS